VQAANGKVDLTRVRLATSRKVKQSQIPKTVPGLAVAKTNLDLRIRMVMRPMAAVVHLNRDLEMKVRPVKMMVCRISGMSPPLRMLWSHLKRVWVRHGASQAKILL
jgi:hypothetical protein